MESFPFWIQNLKMAYVKKKNTIIKQSSHDKVVQLNNKKSMKNKFRLFNTAFQLDSVERFTVEFPKSIAKLTSS